ncbi:dynamin family protein [Bacillus carboniphilus]|uniref:Dynamin family protein n=1 Tax=Bacillus carboniphilus TaxID=86663 RepID=A0ABY9JWC6_9BACI|nr:dynamin family protein [Bacillus carboniphilus]WLR43689.1 dynamin family protein [Bacillus carboniphilus]
MKVNQLKMEILSIFENIKDQLSQSERNKWLYLSEKVESGKIYIAFTGHFSAGKSSILNALVLGEILPSSPVPTSSTIVMLGKGNNMVEATTKDGEIYRWIEGIQPKQIQLLCKGEEVEKVKISSDDFNLKENLMLLDTPGIDSTDTWHQERTNNALYLADAIFYVTDYHHVQSEQNIQFIKNQINKGKNIFLIVNQIDKHNEKEISWSEYEKRIQGTFIPIGLKQENILFTSIYNDELENDLYRLLHNIKRSSIKESIDSLLDDWQEEQIHLVREDLKTSLEDIKKLPSLHQERKQVEKQLNIIASEGLNKIGELRKSIQSIISNANLTPFHIRESIENFIEVKQDTFKKGFVFSKKKTEQTKKQRIQELITQFQKQLDAELNWHLREELKSFYDQNQLSDPTILKEMNEFQLCLDSDDFERVLKEGALLNNEYVLQYGADLKNYVSRMVKSSLDPMLNHIEDEFETRNRINIDEKSAIIIELTEKIERLTEVKERVNNIKQKREQLLQIDGSHSSLKDDHNVYYMKKDEWPFQIKQKGQTKTKQIGRKKKMPRLKEPDQFLLQASVEVQKIDGFENEANKLQNRAKSVKNKTFTVALFGAFSAGKSSFANAWIKDNIFPSSPTPTTAVITKLTRPNSIFMHKQVVISYKTRENFQKEIHRFLNEHGYRDVEIEEGLIQLSKNGSISVKERASVYKSGLSLLEKKKKQQVISIDQLQTYAVKEEEAVIIEEIVIYYDCSLTRSGVTIVDTPGA